MECYSEGMDKYFAVSIPRKSGNKTYLYYRKYNPSESLTLFNSKKTLHDVFNENLKQKIKADETRNIPKTQETLGKVSLKVFQDPRLVTKVDAETKKKYADDKILNGIPADRTVLALNLDENIPEKKYRKWFGTIGKIRRVFTGIHYRKVKKYFDLCRTIAEGGKIRTSTKVYFALIIFKSTKEVSPLFENADYLQTKISVLYKDINLRMKNEGKDLFNMKLVTQYGKNELEKTKSEFQKKMEEGGFQMVGGDIDSFKPPRDIKDEERLRARKKKKRALQVNDFYRFQVKNNTVRDSLNLGEMDMADETDLLKATKRRLKEQFNKDVENFKNKKVKKDLREAEEDNQIEDNEQEEEEYDYLEDEEQEDDYEEDEIEENV